MLVLKHVHEKKRRASKPKFTDHKVLDSVVLVAAFASPLMTIPQVADVWLHPGSGVNELTWCSWLLFAAVWLWYGVIHRIKPVIATNTLWVIVEVAVVVGAALRR